MANSEVNCRENIPATPLRKTCQSPQIQIVGFSQGQERLPSQTLNSKCVRVRAVAYLRTVTALGGLAANRVPIEPRGEVAEKSTPYCISWYDTTKTDKQAFHL
jgi:predicted esterase